MPDSPPRLLLCDCTGTMSPDTQAIARGTGLTCQRVHTHLCRREAGDARAALESGEDVIVACGQEAPAFADLAESLGAEGRLTCVDIRDRAGWSDDANVGPKMAALIAGARLNRPPVPALDVESAGVALVCGPADVVLPAAARLAGVLAVTCLVTDADAVALPPAEIDVAEMDVVAGRIARLTGALGGFAVEVADFADLEPAGRGERRFGPRRASARSDCDLVVDLSGTPPPIPAAHKREGYLRAEPGDPVAVERVLFDAAQLVGTFEKPRYIRFTESRCAHSRARQTGCTRCLDVCPTGAIVPNGDHVALDPMICAGCGNCAAVCPTGAALADAPPVESLFAEMQAMAAAYRDAGGTAPRLLVHDGHGAEMIRLAARFGRGLPADVIPLPIESLGRFGHAEQLAALGMGFAAVDILAGPRTERAPLSAEIALAEAIATGASSDGHKGAPDGHQDAGTARLRLIEPVDPDGLSDLLYGERPEPLPVEPILAAGGRRESVRLAARALARGGEARAKPPAEPIPLPRGAPYGAVTVDTDACTLCMACAGLCPTGALLDNPDRPELAFQEQACIQCGLCANLCPENAIRLDPRLDLSDAAMQARVLNHEEPFECISCGKPFGVKSSIEKITAKLGGQHWMYQQNEQIRLIQMCDNCRVQAQFHAKDAPYKLGETPRPRTTDDDLAEREAQTPGTGAKKWRH